MLSETSNMEIYKENIDASLNKFGRQRLAFLRSRHPQILKKLRITASCRYIFTMPRSGPCGGWISWSWRVWMCPRRRRSHCWRLYRKIQYSFTFPEVIHSFPSPFQGEGAPLPPKLIVCISPPDVHKFLQSPSPADFAGQFPFLGGLSGSSLKGNPYIPKTFAKVSKA
jgi:hypothetical protein